MWKPVKGKKGSAFGYRIDPISGVPGSFHNGLDISAPMGEPVRSAMIGRVSDIGQNSMSGNYVLIKHPFGYKTGYAHLSQINASVGQIVFPFTKIGEIGSTGYSTGPHLHWTVRRNDELNDPDKELQKWKIIRIVAIILIVIATLVITKYLRK